MTVTPLCSRTKPFDSGEKFTKQTSDQRSKKEQATRSEVRRLAILNITEIIET